MSTYQDLAHAIDSLGTPVPCTNAPSLFFPDEEDFSPGALRNYAIRICSECPVKNICLDYALSNNEIYGVWGGTAPGERAALKRRHRQDVYRVA